MTEIVSLDELVNPLTKPYVITRSRLGSSTKVIEEKFVCGAQQAQYLYDSIGEKIISFRPTKAGFQFLVSFTDSTHYENNDISCLSKNLSDSNKKTEKLILNWKIAHEHDGIENEMSVTVRVSNPANPIVMLQAAFSSDHSDADMLDFEDGSVSISVHGATQNTAEEFFSIVQKWAEGCPQPQSITGINSAIYKHSEKIEFLNSWLFPILYSICAYFYLRGLDITNSIPSVFLAFVGFMLIRNLSTNANNQLSRWAHNSRKFSLFSFTGGDQNHQTKIIAKSKNSTIKLIFSVIVSFAINIAAGIVLAKYITS
jgi:hypothetical protein